MAFSLEKEEGLERVRKDNDILAIIIRKQFNKEGLNFLTPDDFPLQLGVHNRKKGFLVPAHAHIPLYDLKDITAQEIFHIQKGKIEVTLFDKQDKNAGCVIINEGDTILLVEGHSIKFLEDTVMTEIKQGPYRGKAKEKRMIT